MKAVNAGKYNKKINIYQTVINTDAHGFKVKSRSLVLTTYAAVKTTRGMTLIRNNTDFEKATTNFTIRYPKTPLNRDMEIDYNGRTYTIEYLNNINEDGVELEIQAKEVTH